MVGLVNNAIGAEVSGNGNDLLIELINGADGQINYSVINPASNTSTEEQTIGDPATLFSTSSPVTVPLSSFGISPTDHRILKLTRQDEGGTISTPFYFEIGASSSVELYANHDANTAGTAAGSTANGLELLRHPSATPYYGGQCTVKVVGMGSGIVPIQPRVTNSLGVTEQIVVDYYAAATATPPTHTNYEQEVSNRVSAELVSGNTYNLTIGQDENSASQFGKKVSEAIASTVDKTLGVAVDFLWAGGTLTTPATTTITLNATTPFEGTLSTNAFDLYKYVDDTISNYESPNSVDEIWKSFFTDDGECVIAFNPIINRDDSAPTVVGNSEYKVSVSLVSGAGAGDILFTTTGFEGASNDLANSSDAGTTSQYSHGRNFIKESLDQSAMVNFTNYPAGTAMKVNVQLVVETGSTTPQEIASADVWFGKKFAGMAADYVTRATTELAGQSVTVPDHLKVTVTIPQQTSTDYNTGDTVALGSDPSGTFIVECSDRTLTDAFETHHPGVSSTAQVFVANKLGTGGTVTGTTLFALHDGSSGSVKKDEAELVRGSALFQSTLVDSGVFKIKFQDNYNGATSNGLFPLPGSRVRIHVEGNPDESVVGLLQTPYFGSQDALVESESDLSIFAGLDQTTMLVFTQQKARSSDIVTIETSLSQKYTAGAVVTQTQTQANSEATGIINISTINSSSTFQVNVTSGTFNVTDEITISGEIPDTPTFTPLAVSPHDTTMLSDDWVWGNYNSSSSTLLWHGTFEMPDEQYRAILTPGLFIHDAHRAANPEKVRINLQYSDQSKVEDLIASSCGVSNSELSGMWEVASTLIVQNYFNAKLTHHSVGSTVIDELDYDSFITAENQTFTVADAVGNTSIFESSLDWSNQIPGSAPPYRLTRTGFGLTDTGGAQAAFRIVSIDTLSSMIENTVCVTLNGTIADNKPDVTFLPGELLWKKRDNTYSVENGSKARDNSKVRWFGTDPQRWAKTDGVTGHLTINAEVSMKPLWRNALTGLDVVPSASIKWTGTVHTRHNRVLYCTPSTGNDNSDIDDGVLGNADNMAVNFTVNRYGLWIAQGSGFGETEGEFDNDPSNADDMYVHGDTPAGAAWWAGWIWGFYIRWTDDTYGVGYDKNTFQWWTAKKNSSGIWYRSNEWGWDGDFISDTPFYPVHASITITLSIDRLWANTDWPYVYYPNATPEPWESAMGTTALQGFYMKMGSAGSNPTGWGMGRMSTGEWWFGNINNSTPYFQVGESTTDTYPGATHVYGGNIITPVTATGDPFPYKDYIMTWTADSGLQRLRVRRWQDNPDDSDSPTKLVLTCTDHSSTFAASLDQGTEVTLREDTVNEVITQFPEASRLLATGVQVGIPSVDGTFTTVPLTANNIFDEFFVAVTKAGVEGTQMDTDANITMTDVEVVDTSGTVIFTIGQGEILKTENGVTTSSAAGDSFSILFETSDTSGYIREIPDGTVVAFRTARGYAVLKATATDPAGNIGHAKRGVEFFTPLGDGESIVIDSSVTNNIVWANEPAKRQYELWPYATTTTGGATVWQSPANIPTTMGDYTVMYTARDADGAIADTKTITVKVRPRDYLENYIWATPFPADGNNLYIHHNNAPSTSNSTAELLELFAFNMDFRYNYESVWGDVGLVTSGITGSVSSNTPSQGTVSWSTASGNTDPYTRERGAFVDNVITVTLTVGLQPGLGDPLTTTTTFHVVEGTATPSYVVWDVSGAAFDSKIDLFNIGETTAKTATTTIEIENSTYNSLDANSEGTYTVSQEYYHLLDSQYYNTEAAYPTDINSTKRFVGECIPQSDRTVIVDATDPVFSIESNYLTNTWVKTDTDPPLFSDLRPSSNRERLAWDAFKASWIADAVPASNITDDTATSVDITTLASALAIGSNNNTLAITATDAAGNTATNNATVNIMGGVTVVSPNTRTEVLNGVELGGSVEWDSDDIRYPFNPWYKIIDGMTKSEMQAYIAANNHDWPTAPVIEQPTYYGYYREIHEFPSGTVISFHGPFQYTVLTGADKKVFLYHSQYKYSSGGWSSTTYQYIGGSGLESSDMPDTTQAGVVITIQLPEPRYLGEDDYSDITVANLFTITGTPQGDNLGGISGTGERLVTVYHNDAAGYLNRETSTMVHVLPRLHKLAFTDLGLSGVDSWGGESDGYTHWYEITGGIPNSTWISDLATTADESWTITTNGTSNFYEVPNGWTVIISGTGFSHEFVTAEGAKLLLFYDDSSMKIAGSGLGPDTGSFYSIDPRTGVTLKLQSTVAQQPLISSQVWYSEEWHTLSSIPVGFAERYNFSGSDITIDVGEDPAVFDLSHLQDMTVRGSGFKEGSQYPTRPSVPSGGTMDGFGGYTGSYQWVQNEGGYWNKTDGNQNIRISVRTDGKWWVGPPEGQAGHYELGEAVSGQYDPQPGQNSEFTTATFTVAVDGWVESLNNKLEIVTVKDSLQNVFTSSALVPYNADTFSVINNDSYALTTFDEIVEYTTTPMTTTNLWTDHLAAMARNADGLGEDITLRLQVGALLGSANTTFGAYANDNPYVLNSGKPPYQTEFLEGYYHRPGVDNTFIRREHDSWWAGTASNRFGYGLGTSSAPSPPSGYGDFTITQTIQEHSSGTPPGAHVELTGFPGFKTQLYGFEGAGTLTVTDFGSFGEHSYVGGDLPAAEYDWVADDTEQDNLFFDGAWVNVIPGDATHRFKKRRTNHKWTGFFGSTYYYDADVATANIEDSTFVGAIYGPYNNVVMTVVRRGHVTVKNLVPNKEYNYSLYQFGSSADSSLHGIPSQLTINGDAVIDGTSLVIDGFDWFDGTYTWFDSHSDFKYGTWVKTKGIEGANVDADAMKYVNGVGDDGEPITPIGFWKAPKTLLAVSDFWWLSGIYEEVDEVVDGNTVKVWLMIHPKQDDSVSDEWDGSASTDMFGKRFQRNAAGEWVGFNRSYRSYPDFGDYTYNMGSASDAWPGETSKYEVDGLNSWFSLLTPGMWAGFVPWGTFSSGLYCIYTLGSDGTTNAYPGQNSAFEGIGSTTWKNNYNNGTLTFTPSGVTTNYNDDNPSYTSTATADANGEMAFIINGTTILNQIVYGAHMMIVRFFGGYTGANPYVFRPNNPVNDNVSGFSSGWASGYYYSETHGYTIAKTAAGDWYAGTSGGRMSYPLTTASTGLPLNPTTSGWTAGTFSVESILWVSKISVGDQTFNFAEYSTSDVDAAATGQTLVLSNQITVTGFGSYGTNTWVYHYGRPDLWSEGYWTGTQDKNYSIAKLGNVWYYGQNGWRSKYNKGDGVLPQDLTEIPTTATDVLLEGFPLKLCFDSNNQQRGSESYRLWIKDLLANNPNWVNSDNLTNLKEWDSNVPFNLLPNTSDTAFGPDPYTGWDSLADWITITISARTAPGAHIHVTEYNNEDLSFLALLTPYNAQLDVSDFGWFDGVYKEVDEEVDGSTVKVWLMFSPTVSTSTSGPRFQRNVNGVWVAFNRSYGYSYEEDPTLLLNSNRYNMGSASVNDAWPGQTSKAWSSSSFSNNLPTDVRVVFGT